MADGAVETIAEGVGVGVGEGIGGPDAVEGALRTVGIDVAGALTAVGTVRDRARTANTPAPSIATPRTTAEMASTKRRREGTAKDAAGGPNPPPALVPMVRARASLGVMVPPREMTANGPEDMAGGLLGRRPTVPRRRIRT